MDWSTAMSEEIELKFIVHPDAVASLQGKMALSGGQHHAAQQLTNTYFDTADNRLRKQGIGLRIRHQPQGYEMTMKTAGRVVGGLHQHPEFNVTLPDDKLDISLLPAAAWPSTLDIDALQSQLVPLFTTDFAREKWVVDFADSQIDVALDRGEVRAGALNEVICELEMELLSGTARDLFSFARTLSQHGGMRLGGLSKAARGYHLLAGNPAREVRPLPILHPRAKATVEQGMCEALNLALAHWQYHEELWLRGQPSAREGVREAITLVRETFVIMGNMVPRKATATLRSMLADIGPALFEEDVAPQQLCYRGDYLESKLALTSWLLFSGWQSSLDEKARKKLAGSFKRFADIALARCGAELKVAFGRTLSREEYTQQLPRLERRLMAFHLLSGAYASTSVVAYLMHWKALQQAIAQPGDDDLEHLRRQALADAGFWGVAPERKSKGKGKDKR